MGLRELHDSFLTMAEAILGPTEVGASDLKPWNWGDPWALTGTGPTPNFGLTQREFADECGVDFTYISKIENGRLESSPSRSLLMRMADCLGESRDVLIDMADQRTKAELQAEIERLKREIAELKREDAE